MAPAENLPLTAAEYLHGEIRPSPWHHSKWRDTEFAIQLKSSLRDD